MNAVINAFANTLQRELSIASIDGCWSWATQYRVMGNPFPGPFSATHHPWLVEMHNSTYEEDVGQKAAQMGYTEWAINVAFYNVWRGYDVLYVLPTTHDASDFSAARFNPALDHSEKLRTLFTDTNNVRLKRTNRATLYIRGSRSKSQLKSIPTPIIVLDEVDEMSMDSTRLVEHRQAGQLFTKNLKLSTPTIEDYGINVDFKLSTQAEYHFRCPSCSKLISLDYPRNFRIIGESLVDPRLKESHFFCHECDRKISFQEKPEVLKHKLFGGTGHFVHAHPTRDKAGWAIGQMYSMSRSGKELYFARQALAAELSEDNKQEFYNSGLGKVFLSSTAKVKETQVRACITDYESGNHTPQGPRTIGIDVGVVNHIVILEWHKLTDVWSGLLINDTYKPKLLFEGSTTGSVNDFQEIVNLFTQFKCVGGVIDAEPERRESLRLCQLLSGRFAHCDYIFSQQGRQIQYDEEEMSLKVNRTSWLDQVMHRFKRTDILLPKDLSKEYIRHICEPARITKQDKWGQKYGVYVNQNPDHLAHATVYAELAFTIFFGDLDNVNITKL